MGASDNRGSRTRLATNTRIRLLYVAAICALFTVFACNNPESSVPHQYYLYTMTP
jgi:hypothetical protein